MTTQVYVINNPLVRGAEYKFEIVVYQKADTTLIHTSVPLAAGDVTIFEDGVLDGNLDTLPVEIGTTGVLTVTISAAETQACTKRGCIKFHDQTSPVAWLDLMVYFETVAAVTIDTILTTALTESYAADGATFTVAQALYEIAQWHNERTVGATTITVAKRDGSATAMTFTYDADSITRTT